jgi:hypothetical protein
VRASQTPASALPREPGCDKFFVGSESACDMEGREEGDGQRRPFHSGAYLLHDAGFSLGEGDVPTRLVADELDLNLPPFASALFVVIVVIVGTRTLAFDAAGLGGDRIAIAVRLVQVGGRCLVVLIRDVGHFPPSIIECRPYKADRKRQKWWRCSFERGADGLYWIWSWSGEAQSVGRCLFVAETWLGACSVCPSGTAEWQPEWT